MACDSSIPISNIKDIWNVTGTKVAIQMDVTDTSSAINSKLLDLLIDGNSKFGVDKFGNICQIHEGTGTPTTGTFPNSGTWGVYYDQSQDTRFFAFNNGTGLDIVEFGFTVSGLQQVSGVDTYTNPTPMPQDFGGLQKDTTFNNTLLSDLFDRMLYPDQSVSFVSFLFSQTTVIELGDFIPSGNKSFLWSTTNDSLILPNTVNILDFTNSITLASGLANDGSENIFIDQLTRTTISNQIWQITAQDITSTDISKFFFVTWNPRVFYGVNSLSSLNASDITGLSNNILTSQRNRLYVFPTGDYKYICYPTSFGLADGFSDDLTQLNVVMENPSVVNVTNTFGVSGNYYVYRTSNILGSSIDIKLE